MLDPHVIPPRPGTISAESKVKTDAGAKAREKVTASSNRVKVAFIRTYLILCTAMFLVVAGIVWYGHTHLQSTGNRVTDTRPCELIDEVRDIHLTGRRHYSYNEKQILGIQYKDTSKMDVTTELDVRGQAMTVVGLSDEGWWSTHIGTGEQGIEMLKPASVLVFTVKDKAVVVNSSTFCK